MKLTFSNNYWALLLFICSFGHLSFNFTDDVIDIDLSNSNPKFTPILPIHVAANSTRTIALSASNTDIIESINLPDFIAFSDLGNGNASFDISPNNIHTGTYILTFIARNALLSTVTNIPLTVYPENGVEPELPAFIGNYQIEMSADSTYHTWIHASYTNEIIAPQLPSFITLTHHGDGASELFIQPNGLNIGTYELDFFALGRHGIDTLNINLSIDSGLVAPQDSLCHLSTVEMFSSSLGF